MLCTIKLGWFGFGRETGKLLGKHGSPKLTCYNIGFIEIVVFDQDGYDLMVKAIDGLAHDSDWLWDNHPEIDRWIQKRCEELAEERVRQYREEKGRLRKRLSESSQALVKRNTEVHTLARAIQIIENVDEIVERNT